MSLFPSFVLGLVQGLTEFLPVSSSAHLILVPWLFRWQDPGMAFDVFLHVGTLLALFLYFFKDWWELFKAGIASIVERKIGYQRERMLFWYIVIGTIPAGIAGLLLHDYVETHFRSPLLIAVTLSSVGFLLYWIDGRYPTLKNMDELRMKDALWIGIAQACALVPGVSRSGATMTMARFFGFNREASARFSFLLSFPVILAANIFEVKKLAKVAGGALSWSYLGTGLAASAIFGMLSIHVLLGYLRNADFRVFAWYRILLAGVIVICAVAFGF